MISQGWIILCLFAVAVKAIGPAPHREHDELLRSALNAVVRKQRSLDLSNPEYYHELRGYKYRGGDPERRFERNRQDGREIGDEEDEEIEFLPNEPGQLETVGNGFEGLNNRYLERALMDYSDALPEQEEPVQSLFRERERSSNRKRGSGNDRIGMDSKELAKLILEELQSGSPYRAANMDDEEYLNTLQSAYDAYRAGGQGNMLYVNEGPMSWSELLNKEALPGSHIREGDENEYMDRDHDQSVLYLTPAERRNVNGRYPIGRELRPYRSLAKRYPVAKRSPKPLPNKKQITDPKVAQDLGALFGTQSTEVLNHTHNHDHERDHSHDHNHNHSHEEHNHDNSSETPRVLPLSSGQKENVTKPNKGKSIEVRKKSVDWSQYFGIDRRKKKASFVPGQNTQNQDDEWMLQRYYENMAENLRPSEQEYESENERKEKLEPRLRNIKDAIVEKLLRHTEAEDSADLQKAKDTLMTRMVAAYSLAKMRKALNELRNNVANHAEAQKAPHAQNNGTSNFRDNGSRTDDKRSGNDIQDEGTEEMKTCPELDAIEEQCKATDILVGDGTQLLYLPCVMLQICKACDEMDECLATYVGESTRICNAQETREGQEGKDTCAAIALFLLELPPPNAVAMQCQMNSNDCLRRYYYRYRHRYSRHPF